MTSAKHSYYLTSDQVDLIVYALNNVDLTGMGNVDTSSIFRELTQPPSNHSPLCDI